MKFKYYDLKSHLFVTFISFSVLSALAFEGWEHEDLGNIAVRANILSLQETLKSPPPDGNQTRVKQALEYLEILKNGVPVDAKNPVTYGSIVRLVDFMRDNYGLTQIVIAPSSGAFAAAERLPVPLQPRGGGCAPRR